MCWLVSMRAWALAASRSGKVESITGLTRPPAINGSTRSDAPNTPPSLHLQDPSGNLYEEPASFTSFSWE